MHKVFEAVKRFRCLTAVWYSICVGYLQFSTSMYSADTAYCSFPVAQCIPNIPKPSWPNGVSFSLGPKGNSYHVTTLLSTKIIFQGPISAFFFLPPPSFFFTLLYFNASSSSIVLIPFFSTKRRKLTEENQLLPLSKKKKNIIFSFHPSDLCAKYWLWSNTYECSGESCWAVSTDTRPDLEPQNPLAANSSSHSATVTW